MGEIFERVMPVRALPWTGERLTSETGGQVEIEHLHRYFVARELCRGLDVLDVAAGEGYGSALLAGVAKSVRGIEIDPASVKHAEAAYPWPNLRYQQGDARSLPCEDASFDAVVSFETIEHFYEHDRFIAEIRRVLRPGGFLIISSPERDVYSPAGVPPNPHHIHELTRVEFTNLLRASFQHVDLYGQRPFLGAALVPETPLDGARPILTYERRDGRLFEGSEGLPRPIYLVAIASDEPRQSLGPSLYIETSGVEAIFTRYTEIEAQLKGSRTEVEAITERLVQEGEYAQRVQAELNRRDTQLAETFRQVQELERRVETAEERTARRNADFVDLLHANEALAGTMGELTNRVLEAETMTRAMRASTSWRVTAPLRFARPTIARAIRAVCHPRLAAASILRRLSLRASVVGAPEPTLAPVTMRYRQRVLERTELATEIPRVTGGGARRALCFGHVPVFPSRAGNEYRVHRLLSWLADTGYDVTLVLCPLPYERPSLSDLAAMAAVYPNVLVLEHDGTLHHSLSTHQHLLKDLPPPATDVAERLGEDVFPEAFSKPLHLTRTFCPDILVSLIEHLDRTLEPDLIVAEYIFQTRVFPLLRPASRKVVDTIDVFSSKAEKVEAFGVTDGLALTEEEERWLASRADVLLAIQPDEGAALARLVPERKVVIAGVDFSVHHAIGAPSRDAVLLLVASDNPMNVAGLEDFFRFAWPSIRQRVPAAELRVVGTIGRAFDDIPDNVTLLGTVPDLEPHYAAARLVINPAAAGTGLKIKTVEALSFLRSVVAWPAGADGLSAEARDYCTVVDSWTAFADSVVNLIEDTAQAERLHAARDAVAQLFAPETVYASLKEILDEC